MESIHGLLKKYWDFDSFRKGQQEIIETVLEGKDVLALLPTGGGKSICYQIPGLAKPGLTLVVSPLISLMYDQVQGLEKRGIRAKAITSEMSYREIDNALENAVYDAYKFLFVSPERLRTDIFLARLNRMNINLITVDEAHCISQWGYDFRPAYLGISTLRHNLPDIPVLALTASATPAVCEDICKQLLFDQSRILRNSFKRDNLAYLVRKTDAKTETIIKMARNLGGSGVVYCNTRKATQDYAQVLLSQGISAGYYHAGLSAEQKHTIQNNWLQGQTQVICATNAFGMGIDKPDVRFVAHVSIPSSPESYFQEAGRAGRDGKKAYALLMFNDEDVYKLRQNFERSFPPIDTIKRVYSALGNALNLATGSGENETFQINVPKLAERYNIHPATLYYALKFLEKEELLAFTESVFQPASFKITVDNRALYDFKLKHDKVAPFLDMLLRIHPGCFDDYVTLKEQSLVSRLKLSLTDFRNRMLNLTKHEILDYRPSSDEPSVTYLKERLHPDAVRISPENYKLLKERAEVRLQAMETYVADNTVCRSTFLLDYFGEKALSDCGICDVCIAKSKTRKSQRFDQRILESIQNNPLSASQLVTQFSETDAELVRASLNRLIDENKIKEVDNLLTIN